MTKQRTPALERAASEAEDRNVVLVIGEIADEPTIVAADGGAVTTFAIRVRNGTGPSVLVPIRWVGEHGDLERGERVAVAGAVVRRFFRSGATTQSRTDVLVERLEKARTRSQRQRVYDLVEANLARP